MSLKAELADLGVKLTDLAKELEESYGNLYTALQREESGEEIRHKAVQARIQKVRDWLDADKAGAARAAAAVEDATNVGRLLNRIMQYPGSQSWVTVLNVELVGGRALKCGDVITTVTEGQRERWRFLRFVTAKTGKQWFDVFGPLPTSEKSMAPAIRSLTPRTLGLEVAG